MFAVNLFGIDAEIRMESGYYVCQVINIFGKRADFLIESDSLRDIKKQLKELSYNSELNY